ncbi:UNVERIFIED_CONTAM: hypothetical protein Sindi_1894700 [Sesamum indicum]
MKSVEDSYRSWSVLLYKALNQGNWETVETIVMQQPAAITARLTPFAETPLLVAVKAGQGLPFIRKLLHFMQPEALALTDYFGNTALHAVAVLGNIQAARLFVEQNRNLLNIWNIDGCLPIHLAAMRGHREMTLYLFSVTREDKNLEPFNEAAGATLVHFALTSGFYDLALYLVEHNPGLAWQHEDISPLELLAQEPSAFPSGMDFNFWQFFMYSCVPEKLVEIPESLVGLTRSPKISSFKPQRRCTYEELHVILWKVLETLAKPFKHIRHRKAMHHQALQLIKQVCAEIRRLDNAKAASILTGPFLLGTQNGIHEIVKEILDSFPQAITFVDEENHSVFHLAVMYRHEKVFKIVHEQSGHYNMSLSLLLDNERNNILHLAGYRPHLDRLDLSSGAVLRMQRELQWFKEVENFVHPHSRERLNYAGKSPKMVFTEEHKILKEEGEKWMKDTSNSCTIAAALIATVMFAAAITVPGGNDSSNGFPIFSGNSAFIMFAISDAVSLFTSATSLLMFLAILTSRYAEEDFLYVLPKRLIIGLGTLFLSITFMMVAFSATLYLVFGRKESWVLIPVGVLACLPVTSFVLLQFPLLVDLVYSTYGPGIFGKQSNRPFH